MGKELRLICSCGLVVEGNWRRGTEAAEKASLGTKEGTHMTLLELAAVWKKSDTAFNATPNWAWYPPPSGT